MLSSKLDENIHRLRNDFCSDICSDLIIREFLLCGNVRAAVAFINGMSDSDAINDFILRDGMRKATDTSNVDTLISNVIQTVIPTNDITQETDYSLAKSAILVGKSVILIDTQSTCLLCDTRKFPQRSISAPENEKSIFGPKEAFIENMRTNITLIRRIVRTSDLVCEMRTYGTDSKSTIGIMYRDGVVNRSLLSEVKKRISSIDTSAVLSTGMLEQFVEESAISPLPQAILTERPDRCASFLSNGHIVLLCDGTPMAAILPVTLFSLLSTPEDIYARRIVGSIMRVVRYVGALISILVPGLFISTVMFHQGFLSAQVISTLITTRKMVFIPIGAETLFLLLVFQLVREAGMRVPGTIGQAIGIIGGLVLGQAVVSANLASSIVLIIVALTSLGNLCIPDYSTQLSALFFRILFILLGWAAGFLGITCGLMLCIGYVCTQKSFGVPFMSPLAPKTASPRPVILRGKIRKNAPSETDYVNRKNI